MMSALSRTSEPCDPDNLLDRLSSQETLEHHYRRLVERERAILVARLPLTGGRVLSGGAGWHPGRHLFPAPAFHLVAVQSDPAKVAGVLETGRAEQAIRGSACQLTLPAGTFDVVLYRLVMHPVGFPGPLAPCFGVAARLLAPGGALAVIELGRGHPIGAGLALANRLGLGELAHGTPDDVPRSPRALLRGAGAAGLEPELHTVTYTWRRLTATVQRRLGVLDGPGSRPRAARFGHTLMLVARAP